MSGSRPGPDTWSQTPSQTVGPFFHYALTETPRDDLDPDHHAGRPVVIRGRVLDGQGAPVGDAMLEVWQADGGGRYRHPADGRAPDVSDGFVGFGRIATEASSGRFEVHTAMPGTVPGRDGGVQAPHLNVHVFARGLLRHLHTRIYFEDGPGNDQDPVLASVPAERRATLLARRDATASDATAVAYRFDLVLQGADETVFFEA